MGYKFMIEIHYLNEFKSVKDLQNFMDDLRSFLEKHKIDRYEDTAEQDGGTIKTETWFTNSCPNLNCLRNFLEDVRAFLKENNIKEYKYKQIGEYVKPGL